MSIQWINDEPLSNDLPWLKEYVREVGRVGDEMIVSEFISASKGYLVLTAKYKGMIWNGDKAIAQIEEVLRYMVANPSNACPLIAKIKPNVSLMIGIDSEAIGDGTWLPTDKGWRFTLKKDLGEEDFVPGSLLSQLMTSIEAIAPNDANIMPDTSRRRKRN